MGELPAEIGDEQKAVEGPANDVINPNLRRKSGVSSLVSQNPNSSHDSSLGKEAREVSTSSQQGERRQLEAL